MRLYKTLLVTLFLIAGILNSTAQKEPEKSWNSARILHEIEKVKHVGRVLYIAAHPDDENTQLIAYLANVKGIDIAYMSLTRGDGGQDLLGPQVRDELGVIRTQELLMARATDGGQQFFSRANDFGFSKTAEETLHIWDSNEVLSDIVWEIRRFKPDIIITRFSPTYKKTHGHHQASAILTQQAFDDAANPDKFPEQLKYVDTWQAKSLFWNTSTFFFMDNKMDTAGLYNTNIGAYIPLLGKSVGEIAAESRSMHKSQGMGSTPRLGDIMEYFVYMKGEKPAGKDIFSDYNWDWNRIKGCETVSTDVEKIISNFDMLHPEKSVDVLILLHKKLEHFKDDYLVQPMLQQIEDIILQCEGVYAEALSTKKFLSVDDSISVTLNIVKQNNSKLFYTGANFEIDENSDLSIKEGAPLKNNDSIIKFYVDSNHYEEAKSIPYNKPISLKGGDSVHECINQITGPYWLEEEHTVGMYKVDNQMMRGLPQNPTQVVVNIFYLVGDKQNNIDIVKQIPVFYKFTDPIKGDIYSLARIVPPAVIIPEENTLVFTNYGPKKIHIKIKSFKKGTATIEVQPPQGYTMTDEATDMASTNEITMPIKGNGVEYIDTLDIRPIIGPGKIPPLYNHMGNINISIEMNGHSYNRSMEDITYEHIPEQILLPKSTIKVVEINMVTHPKLIGYIQGAGDDIPQCLTEMGYKVEVIPATQLATSNLSKYDAIIAGIRAYNTVDELKYDNARLMDYVKNGGNYIVQYNNNFRLVTDSIGPYYLHPANVRTTEEDSKVTFLNPTNPALNIPNKITEKDFEGWVQERGLYYPDKWDTAHYIPLLEMNDAGEAPTKGALLVAQYGKGNFVYTGLVFFRELPAGVPGAYRLLANLIELEKH